MNRHSIFVALCVYGCMFIQAYLYLWVCLYDFYMWRGVCIYVNMLMCFCVWVWLCWCTYFCICAGFYVFIWIHVQGCLLLHRGGGMCPCVWACVCLYVCASPCPCVFRVFMCSVSIFRPPSFTLLSVTVTGGSDERNRRDGERLRTGESQRWRGSMEKETETWQRAHLGPLHLWLNWPVPAVLFLLSALSSLCRMFLWSSLIICVYVSISCNLSLSQCLCFPLYSKPQKGRDWVQFDWCPPGWWLSLSLLWDPGRLSPHLPDMWMSASMCTSGGLGLAFHLSLTFF